MTESHDHPIWELLDRMQMDMRAMNAKLTDLRARVAALNLVVDEPLHCPHCGPWHRSAELLEEHLYSVDPERYPLPAHWAAADTRARLETTESEAA